ncbi:MAG: TetR/AcrR family transcriptional regulator [Thermotogae bacterium]|nr:TetR/AcrR family transcriptional regulator [Thermotogota bacterium]
MPIIYSEEMREKRKNEILNAAEKVFFSKGYEKASMNDVAKEAGIAKGTLYLYFRTKKDLYFAIGNRALDIIVAKFYEIARSNSFKNGLEKVEALAYFYFDFSKKHPDYHKFLINYHSEIVNFGDINPSVVAAYMKSGRIFRLLVSCVEEGMKDGSIRDDISPIKLAVLLWTKTVGTIEFTRLKEPIFKTFAKIEADEIVEEFIKLERELIRKK